MKVLSDKRILFIAPAFFGYELKIADKMVELGAVVDYFDERSVRSNYAKALLKINPQIFKNRSVSYYDSIISKISNETYDFVLVIKCEMMPVETIKKLKSTFKNSIFCLYMYDSIDNIKGIKDKLKYFDRVLTFDKGDTLSNSGLLFRPLFYIDEFNKPNNYKKEYEYDVSFVGTIHSDRYNVIKSIKKLVDQNQYKSFFYCYLQSRFMYYFYKITRSDFRSARIEDFSFDKLNSSQISEIIDKTKVVLDIQHPKQTGLTMRTIEMIGLRKKIITTNKAILEYDFYKPENIAVIDRNEVVLRDEFLRMAYSKLDDLIYNKYSLESWIVEVLGVKYFE